MLFNVMLSVVMAAHEGKQAANPRGNRTLCDYYTTALLKNNTAKNQLVLLQLVVNAAVIGNYTQPNVGIKVPGILANATVNGEDVSLLPYFSGALTTTNRDGKAVSINFLDGGGAGPLKENKLPTTGSNQYRLFNHLYQYFGYLLGCSQMGTQDFPNYQGSTSMANVHHFMNLTSAQMSYFIEQVVLAAASYGVSQDDGKIVNDSLNSVFNRRCSPPVAVPATADPESQSICQAPDCLLDPSPMCKANNNFNGTLDDSSSTSTGTSTDASTGASSSPTTTTTTRSAAASLRPILSLAIFLCFML